MDTVTHRIADSLHSEPIVFLLETDGHYRPAYCLGLHGREPDVTFAKQSATCRFLARMNAPARVYFDDPQSWAHGVSDREQTALLSLHTQVLVPVTQKSRLLGMLSL